MKFLREHPIGFLWMTLGIVTFFILICCGWFYYQYYKDGGICGSLASMIKLPFYALLFALSMIFLSIWCLFCCCCPCCPQWFQNLPNTIFELIDPPPDRKLIEYLHNYSTRAINRRFKLVAASLTFQAKTHL